MAWSRIGDTLIRRLPLWMLIGFQGFRLPLELLMHRAHASGVMPVQMSFEGRNYDIATGASALLLALIVRRRATPHAWIWAWNVLGLALLGNIVVIAVLSTPRFQVFGPEHLNTFVADSPYVLLPTIMVLAAWTGHLLVLRVLLRSPTKSTYA